MKVFVFRLILTLKNNIIVVNVSKGFHPETSERMSEVIRRCISKEHLSSVVSLIGPSHAEEVVIRLLTTIDAVSLKEEDARVRFSVLSLIIIFVFIQEMMKLVASLALQSKMSWLLRLVF